MGSRYSAYDELPDEVRSAIIQADIPVMVYDMLFLWTVEQLSAADIAQGIELANDRIIRMDPEERPVSSPMIDAHMVQNELDAAHESV